MGKVYDAAKNITASFIDGRKVRYFLIGIPATLLTAWASKQLGLDANIQNTLITGVMLQVGTLIGGQALSDAATKGATSRYVQKLKELKDRATGTTTIPCGDSSTGAKPSGDPAGSTVQDAR